MSWRKYFTPASASKNTSNNYSPLGGRGTLQPGPAQTNYSSYLPDVYVGSPNRVERYGQYNTMDLDSEVNAALDILAEFCTQENKQNGTPFTINFLQKATNSETTIIQRYLQQWCKIQNFYTRMFRILRNTFKYGDQFFIRDPETKKWYHVDPANVLRIIVNESEGKIPEQYIVKNFNLNFKEMVATTPYQTNGNVTGGGSGYLQGGVRGMVGAPNQQMAGSRFMLEEGEIAVDAKHIVHLSLSEGLDNNFPFGNSLLETVFKVYKQKELLEDAIIIYRVQRAPERRVFYVDVGNMPAHLAMQFVERVKTEIHQRRIPSSTGGGQNVIDSSYNPLCLDLETKIPLLDGRTLSLNRLIEEFNSGKENWAYSCNPETGEVVPGVINWAGITRKNTEVIKLTFDNGKTLTCTPDHKIPVFGKGFVEAKDIKTSDSLISFETRNKKISQNSNDYQQVWDHSEKTWKWTHRLVGEFFRNQNKHQEFTFLHENIGKEKTVIHHKDYDRFNNDPRNLQYMNKSDHILYHASTKEEYWKNLSENKRRMISDKISGTLKTRWKNMSNEERQTCVYNIRKAQKKSVWMRQNDPVTKASYRKNQSVSRKNYIKNNPKFKEILNNNLENRLKIRNQEINLTFEMLQIVVDIIKTQSKNKNDVIALCDNNEKLLNLVKKENSIPLDYKNAQCKIDFTKFGYSKLNKLIKVHGYKNWKHFVKSIDQFNHKVVKIEKLSNRDTGTITIDGTERWHDYHTFAIDSGIFVKNSINEDYFFPQTCLSLNTEIKLLDNRSLTLKEIIQEYIEGKTNYTYTVNQQTCELEQGKIVWAGVTRKNAQVVKVTLDSGNSVVCTPDHRFIMRDGSETEAQHLSDSSSVMSLYSDHERTLINQNKVISVEFLNDCIDTGDITIESASNSHNFALTAGIFVHNSEGRGSKVETLPGGCLAMNTKVSLLDGRELSISDIEQEMSKGNELWTYSVDPTTGNIAPGLISWAGVTHESAKVMRLTFDNGETLICTPDHKFPIYGKGFVRADELSVNESMMALYRKKEKISKHKKLDYEQFFNIKTKSWEYTHRMVADYLRDSAVSYYVHNEEITNGQYDVRHHKDFNRYNNNSELLEELTNLNASKKVPNWDLSHGFTESMVKKIPIEFGYKSWTDFRKKESVHNHRLVKIEYLDDEISVGTLTIDYNEIYHDYHTFALSCGVFTKNSNLGEIDDLRYFTNKLVRGLRIPSSYLPTGADDASSQYNDGRVGTAYIQELRFNTYCERLQGLLSEEFDQEFKRYLLEKGINIDTSMFNLKFQPPQNFAAYRQSEIDNARVPTYSQMSAIPYVSNRFALKRFLGLSEEEIAENERLWREENEENIQVSSTDSAGELRSVGITGAGIGADFGGVEDQIPGEMPVDGGDMGGAPGGDMGGAPGGDIGGAPGGAPGGTPPPGPGNV